MSTVQDRARAVPNFALTTGFYNSCSSGMHPLDNRRISVESDNCLAQPGWPKQGQIGNEKRPLRNVAPSRVATRRPESSTSPPGDVTPTSSSRNGSHNTRVQNYDVRRMARVCRVNHPVKLQDIPPLTNRAAWRTASWPSEVCGS